MCHTCNARTDLTTWDAPYNPLGRPVQFCAPCLHKWRRTLRPVHGGYFDAATAGGFVPIRKLTQRAARRIEAAYPVRFLRPVGGQS